MDKENLELLSINTIRTLAMDAVEKAGSGHPGTAMALAPAAYVLWTKIMKYNPKDPAWLNRDRFVLSNGHASILQYSLLHLTGYDLSLMTSGISDNGEAKHRVIPNTDILQESKPQQAHLDRVS